MPGIIGKKVGMTQVFDEKGEIIPATVIEAGPCPIVQVKTPQKDGYAAIQVGFGVKREKNLTKPVVGHYRKTKTPVKAMLREFRVDDASAWEAGQEIKVDQFEEGPSVLMHARTSREERSRRHDDGRRGRDDDRPRDRDERPRRDGAEAAEETASE